MSDLDRRRFVRQIRLAEVGESGQRELCRATVTVGGAGSADVDVERAYLAAAGVHVATGEGPAPTTDEVSRVLQALSLETEEARAFAEGALRALTAIRAILDVG